MRGLISPAVGLVLCFCDAVWRQWAVGDVIQMLNTLPAPESVNPPDPPELAWCVIHAAENKR